MSKTLTNTTASKAVDNVPDLEIWGDGDMWKLLCKASSKAEGWMKSTKAMEIPGLGCLVQVTTQQRDQVAEAVCFVMGTRISNFIGDDGEVVKRVLGPLPGYLSEKQMAEAHKQIDEMGKKDYGPYDKDSVMKKKGG